MPLRHTLLHLAAAILTALAPSAQATMVIDNSTSTPGWVYPFGSGAATATYGEAFRTDDSNTWLTDFSMSLHRYCGSSDLLFRAYLGAWDGSRVTSIDYRSDTVVSSAAGGNFTFEPGLALAPNADYIAFLSVSELAAQAHVSFLMPFSGYQRPDASSATRGFFFLNNRLDSSRWTSSPWQNFVGGDVRFRATLNQPRNAVPEPATWALFALALAAAMLAQRRGRHGAAHRPPLIA